MARKRTRTRSGRLRAPERRRRLRAAGLRPGEVIILDQSRRQTKGVRGGKNSLSVELVALTQIGIDTDVRKLLHTIRVALAQHYSESLLAGRRPDGRGTLPDLKPKTLASDPNRDASSFAVDSGEMAARWLLLKIRGNSIRASTRIKPFGGEGRRFMINRLLERGIDFQSVAGDAAELIQRIVTAWLPRAAPAEGDGVATPRQVPQGGGELPQMR